MEFYFFTSDFNLIKELETIGFEGVLFTYNAKSHDYFIRIARNISSETKIKHMVAIRPYVISPQYLSMISKSIGEIKKDILQINLISGHIKDEEKHIGGIVGSVNDSSSSIERSKYLIEYIGSLENLGTDKPDYYISASNEFTIATAKKYNSKTIIAYSQYKNNLYDFDRTKSMISITPILRKTQEEIDALPENTIQHRIDMENFTYEQFNDIVDNIKNDNINKIIMSAWNMDETRHIINFVKQYKLEESIKEKIQ
jgi:hypothetical protein